MFHDENFLYLKIPKAMGNALIKSIIQAAISCKNDTRSNTSRKEMAAYILLQFANEIGNTPAITTENIAILNSVFDSQKETESNDG